MSIANMHFNFFTGIDNDATGITFYDETAEMVDGKYKVLWVADTELKDGKLYLTITTDNISDYVGKTIILYQRPVQSEE